MKKVLIVTTRSPYPVIGGDRLRIQKVAEYAVSRGCEVSILSLAESQSTGAIESISFPSSFLNRIAGVMRAFFSGVPLQCGLYYNPCVSRYLKNNSSKYDVVILHLVRSAIYLEDVKDAESIVCEMTDAISLNYSRFAGFGLLDWKWWYFKFEGPRLLKYERWVAGRVDASILVSETDSDYLISNGVSPDVLIVAKNGVATRDMIVARNRTVGDSPVILFVGNMESKQNQDMVLFFINEICPSIIATGDKFTLRIAGAVPADFYRQISSTDYVEVFGTYDEFEDLLESVVVGICPMRFGAGIQNKVLDYLSVGLPVVSTPYGNEGINCIDGESILIAATSHEFSACVVNILQRPNDFLPIGRSGRNYVRSQFGWNERLRSYNVFLDKTENSVSSPNHQDKSV